MSRARIVVIGGGLAGLRAAIHCVDEGAEVLLLESRKRLGGATWSNFHRGLGFEIDNGQHVFMRCCDHYLAFLDRLRVRDRVTLQDRLRVPIARPDQRTTWIRRGPLLPAPAHLAPSLLRLPGMTPRERIHMAWTAMQIGQLDPNDPALDDQSLGHWLRDHGEPEHVIDGIWDLLIRPTLNLPAREASLALAVRVMRTGFLDSAEGADLGWSRVPFQELHAGPARRVLEENGARILTGMPVDAIESSPSNGCVVFSKGTRFDADAVILAVPHDVAARLLPQAENFNRPALAKLPHSPIVNLHAVFDRKITEHAFVAGHGTPLEWIFDRTEMADLDGGQYLTVSLSSADRWLGHSTQAMRGIFEGQFASLFPAARDARLDRFAVTIEPRATFRAGIGTRRIRPEAGCEIGGVHLAGAWTHTGWPATMESAVRSGLIAASAALSSLAARKPNTKKEAA